MTTLPNQMGAGELGSMFATFATTLAIFGIYLFQGVLVARILGPLGRGEFGHAIYFPRDVLLYAGLLGGIEIVNTYATKGLVNTRTLKYSAAKLGFVSGLLTAVLAAGFSVLMLLTVGKAYLIPFCLVACAFIPWEHMHLVISAVDRGKADYRRYNVNRLLFALSFPLIVCIAFGLGLEKLLPGEHASLWLMCSLFVLARIAGLLPTLRGMDVWTTFKRTVLTRGSEPATELIPRPNVKQLLNEGRPYAFSMLATEVFERLDIFLIMMFATVETSGHYFVAVPAAALLTVAPNALGVFTFNAGANPDRKISFRDAISVMSGTAVFQVATTIVFWWVIPTLMIMVFTDKYAESVPFVLALAPACAIKGYLQAIDGYLKGRGKPLIGVWSRMVSIVAMLVFFFFAYPHYGLFSIPFAACFGQAISMLIISAAVLYDVDKESKAVASTETRGG